MKRFPGIRLLSIGMLAAGIWLSQASEARAEIVEGRAPIVNGQVAAAREAAMLDAMRTLAEKEVGVFIDSQTEVKNFMVVSDRIMSDSQGYVKVNKILTSKKIGDIYYVKLDLTADAAKIETAVSDVKAALESRVTENSRVAGLLVAVSSKGMPQQTASRVNAIVANALEEIGFVVRSNNQVNQLLVGKNMANPAHQALLRREARSRREGGETALVTGYFSVYPQTSPQEATVAVQFNLIGLDSNLTNSYAENVTGHGVSYELAVADACEQAARQGAERLGQKVLRSLQGEQRGGRMRLNTVLYIDDVYDVDSQYPGILAALDNAGVAVKLPPGYAEEGRLKIVVTTQAYANLAELQQAVIQRSNGLLGMQAADEADIGASAVYLAYRGNEE